MNTLNFKKFNKRIFIPFLVLLVSCKESIPIFKLEYKEDSNYSHIQFEKVFEMFYYQGIEFAIPYQDKVVVLITDRGKGHKLLIYDYLGKIIKEKTVEGGEGPEEIGGTSFHSIIQINQREIVFVDIRDYIKSINPTTLEMKTLGKLSNLIKGYGRKHRYPRYSLTSIERKESLCIAGFASTGFWDNGRYYFVKFNGLFENFRIISSAKKEAVKAMDKKISEAVKKGESYIDYYKLLRSAIIFSVDFKREFIYYIPEIERPIIEGVDFYDKSKKRFEISLDFKKFKIKRERLEFFCNFAINFSPFKKVSCYIPPHAPPLQDLKVINDQLFVITGNREWENEENQVLVYKLPNMKYEGSFYIPFPNHFKSAWYDNYYIIRSAIEKENDYYQVLRIYKIKAK